MNVQSYDFYRWLLFCIAVFGAGGATTTRGQQQDTNDATPLIADVNQLKDKVKTQEDIILRANARISELERQLAEQTKQNNRLKLLCEKAGIKITEESDENSSPNQLKNQRIEPNIPNTIANKTKDAEIEMSRIKIQKMSDAIERDIKRLNNLPALVYEGADTFAPDKAIQDNINTLTTECRLLQNIERNYNSIIHLATSYPELGINVMAMEKKLIHCQKDRQNAESKIKYWQKLKDTPVSHR